MACCGCVSKRGRRSRAHPLHGVLRQPVFLKTCWQFPPLSSSGSVVRLGWLQTKNDSLCNEDVTVSDAKDEHILAVRSAVETCPRLCSSDRATLTKPPITAYSAYCSATIMAADVVTRLISRYICMAELRSLLDTNFSGAYTVKIGGEYIEVTAPRELSTDEIKSVTWSE